MLLVLPAVFGALFVPVPHPRAWQAGLHRRAAAVRALPFPVSRAFVQRCAGLSLRIDGHRSREHESEPLCRRGYLQPHRAAAPARRVFLLPARAAGLRVRVILGQTALFSALSAHRRAVDGPLRGTHRRRARYDAGFAVCDFLRRLRMHGLSPPQSEPAAGARHPCPAAAGGGLRSAGVGTVSVRGLRPLPVRRPPFQLL